MENIEFSVAHILGFIYLAFAHQTDGVLTKEEHVEIWRKIRDRSRSEYTYIRFAQIMDETTDIYRKKMNDDNIMDIVLELASDLKEFPWFTKKQRRLCIKDLIEIAKSDGNVETQEKIWLAKIAKVWEIEKQALNKLLQ